MPRKQKTEQGSGESAPETLPETLPLHRTMSTLNDTISGVESDLSSGSDDDDQTEITEAPPPSPKKRVPRQRATGKVIQVGEDLEVEVKRRMGRPPKKAKQRIVLYREDIESSESEDEVPEVVMAKPRGRPKKNIKVVLPPEQAQNIIVSERKMTKKEEKELAKVKDINKLEETIGRPVKVTNKGKPDKRSTKAPTPAQLAARQKFAEMSRKRAADRKAGKVAETNQMVKESVQKGVEEAIANVARSGSAERQRVRDQMNRPVPNYIPQQPPQPVHVGPYGDSF